MKALLKLDILYEDNHIIIVNKRPGEIVQGDKTGDQPLSEAIKDFIKVRDNKPGNVFIGVVHRLDRPVGGAVVFAKTSKALSRLNSMFREGTVSKRYWAIIEKFIEPSEGCLINQVESVERNNKTYICENPTRHSKEAKLKYRTLCKGDKYSLVEVELLTGRKHQIRAQLAHTGHPIKGDLKYGAKRSNTDGSISLFAREISFVHPVSKKKIEIKAPFPNDDLWQKLTSSKDSKPKH